jgi:hypothetical protein
MPPGVPADRVVAVLARLDTGRTQVGSGYLVSARQILTARDCTVDATTGRPARSLRVVRLAGGAPATATLAAAATDVAVLTVAGDAAWAQTAELEPPRFGRINAGRAGTGTAGARAGPGTRQPNWRPPACAGRSGRPRTASPGSCRWATCWSTTPPGPPQAARTGRPDRRGAA